MRGAAVIAAATAGWVLATGRIPRLPFRLPKLDPALLLAGVGTGGAFGLIALRAVGAPALALGIGVVVAVLPSSVAAAIDRRRAGATVAQWPDVITGVRSHLAGGASLPDAFLAAVRMAGADFADAAAEVERAVVYGRGFPAAVEALRDRFADPMADRVLVTIAAAHRSGGHRVSAILATLGGSVADELRLRRAHDAAMTQQRLTAAVALVAPWLLLVLSITTNPQAAEAYRSHPGPAIIYGGLIATGAGYWLARRTARLAHAPRLFS